MSIELDSRAAGMSRGGSSSALALEGLNECSPCSSSSSASPSPSPSPSSSSSIGRNSDVSSDGEDCGENEAQSSYKGPLDMMEALEEVLPIRRGISNFYNGKSKSFTSLTEASSSSNIKDIAKAENAYTRKRRNLLAFNQVWEKNRNFPLKSQGGGISKRPLSSSRSTLAFAVAMSSSSSESISNSSDDSISRSPPLPSSPLPPRHPQSKSTKNSILSSSPPQLNSSAWRSFSMVDLQQCATSATTTTSTYQLWTKPVIPN